MKSSANFSCWRIDRSIERTPDRIFISRSIRRSSLLLNNPMTRSFSTTTTRRHNDTKSRRVVVPLWLHLPVLRRGALTDGLVGLLETFILLHRAAVHVVPDVHQLLAGAGQAGR